jgi:hypothetical protein
MLFLLFYWFQQMHYFISTLIHCLSLNYIKNLKVTLLHVSVNQQNTQRNSTQNRQEYAVA